MDAIEHVTHAVRYSQKAARFLILMRQRSQNDNCSSYDCLCDFACLTCSLVRLFVKLKKLKIQFDESNERVDSSSYEKYYNYPTRVWMTTSAVL